MEQPAINMLHSLFSMPAPQICLQFLCWGICLSIMEVECNAKFDEYRFEN